MMQAIDLICPVNRPTNRIHADRGITAFCLSQALPRQDGGFLQGQAAQLVAAVALGGVGVDFFIRLLVLKNG